jgi:hypothetical protein
LNTLTGIVFGVLPGQLTVALLLALPVSNAMAQDEIRLREQDGIAWACGGVGYGERSALKALESRSNLVVLFVSGTRGAFVADVRLRITSPSLPDLGLETASDGPLCVLRLPAGTWQIQANWRGETRQQTVQISAATGALRRVTLSFPEDKDASPATTPEERSGVGDSGKANTGR